jgi:hypothetical protein
LVCSGVSVDLGGAFQRGGHGCASWGFAGV